MTPFNKHKDRRDKQKKRSTSLNLIALMDIFTILVFFLMVNQSDVEVIPAQTAVKLPDSTSKTKPSQQLLIMVSGDKVLLEGKPITTTDQVISSEGEDIPELVSHLKTIASTQAAMSSSITILGDKDIPYQILKRIIASCAAADFTNIALATNQVTAFQTATPGRAS